MYNVDGMFLSADAKAELIAQVMKQDQKIDQMVVMANLDLALQLKPYVREMIYRDHPTSPDWSYKKVSLQQTIDGYAPACSNGLTGYIDNEPGPDESGWVNCFNYLTAVAEAFASRGWKCALGNWSVGRPDKNDWLSPAGQRFLRTVSKHRRYCRIGLHEYVPSFWAYELTNEVNRDDFLPAHRWNQLPGFTDQTWYVGRYVTLFAVFDILKLPRAEWPKISITETGFDRVDDAKAWQQTVPGYNTKHFGIRDHIQAFTEWGARSNISWVEYAYRSLEKMYEVFFRDYEHLLTGVSFFCFGGQGVWVYYDVSTTPLRYAFDKNPFASGKGAPPVATTIQTGLYRVPSGVTSLVRDVPGGTTIGRASGGTIVRVVNSGLRTFGNYDWANIKIDEADGETIGWMALLAPPERIEYVGPYTPPAPEGGLTANQKAHLSELLDNKREADQALEAFLNGLLN